jgi:hypothetical protein
MGESKMEFNYPEIIKDLGTKIGNLTIECSVKDSQIMELCNELQKANEQIELGNNEIEKAAIEIERLKASQVEIVEMNEDYKVITED